MGTNNVNKANTKDVSIVAKQILNNVNQEVNEEIGRQTSNNNKALVASVTRDIINNVTKKDITNRINSRNLVTVSNKEKLNGLNNTTRKLIVSINNATTLKELRKIYLKGALDLHPNKGGNKDTFQAFMRAHNKKQKLLKSGNVNYVANKIMKEINKDVIKQVSNGSKNNKILAIANKPVNSTESKKQTAPEPSQEDIEYVTNQILNKLQNEVQNEISKKPIYNSNSNSNSNNNVNNKKPIYNSNSNSNSNNKKINNPLFEPNMKNNPLFNERNSESKELSKYINNLGLENGNKKKLMNLFNTTNQTLENAKRNASTLSNTRKLQNNVNNFNNKKNALQNKITKELNMRPNNNGVFRERKGLTKGRIGVWANELRKAETIDDLKAIENTLNEKVELRKNIENKYTKMGLTNKSEKARHRNAAVKFKNNANARRKEIENYLNKTPTLMNRGSYQSKVNRLQRELPKGTSPATRRNWMKKSKIYTGRIQKALKYGDMVKAYNNAMKSFKNLSK